MGMSMIGVYFGLVALLLSGVLRCGEYLRLGPRHRDRDRVLGTGSVSPSQRLDSGYFRWRCGLRRRGVEGWALLHLNTHQKLAFLEKSGPIAFV